MMADKKKKTGRIKKGRVTQFVGQAEKGKGQKNLKGIGKNIPYLSTPYSQFGEFHFCTAFILIQGMGLYQKRDAVT